MLQGKSNRTDRTALIKGQGFVCLGATKTTNY